jgi:hypothetical protein
VLERADGERVREGDADVPTECAACARGDAVPRTKRAPRAVVLVPGIDANAPPPPESDAQRVEREARERAEHEARARAEAQRAAEERAKTFAETRKLVEALRDGMCLKTVRRVESARALRRRAKGQLTVPWVSIPTDVFRYDPTSPLGLSLDSQPADTALAECAAEAFVTTAPYVAALVNAYPWIPSVATLATVVVSIMLADGRAAVAAKEAHAKNGQTIGVRDVGGA